MANLKSDIRHSSGVCQHSSLFWNSVISEGKKCTIGSLVAWKAATTFSRMTLNIMTFNDKMTFSTTTLSITTKNAICSMSKKDTQNIGNTVKLSLARLRVPFTYCYAERRYLECDFSECHYAGCLHAECHTAEFGYAECHIFIFSCWVFLCWVFLVFLCWMLLWWVSLC